MSARVDGKIKRERGGVAERESSKDSERKERDPRDQVQSHVKTYAANSSHIPRLGPYLDVLRWMLASEPEIRLFLPFGVHAARGGGGQGAQGGGWAVDQGVDVAMHALRVGVK